MRKVSPVAATLSLLISGIYACPLDAGPAPRASAEFAGVVANDMPRIAMIELDASGDGKWGIDNIEYGGLAAVPIPAAAWLFVSALGGLVVAKRRQLKA